MNLLIKTFLTIFWLLLSAQGALAEQADRTKPVNIDANSVDMDDLHKVGVYDGNVILTQGTLMLRADKLVVHQNGDGFSTAVAYGNPVYFRQKQDGSDDYIEASANRIDLDNKLNTVLLTGDAKLKKGADLLHASTMFYNTVTQRFWAKNEANATAGQSAGGNRVHTSIYPQKVKPTSVQQDGAAPLLEPTTALPPAVK